MVTLGSAGSASEISAVLPLQQTAALPAGIYVLRLTQSGREAVTRAALMR